MWSVFGVMALYVLVTRDWTLLDSHSFLRQRYAPIPWLMMAHGIPGALALVLGVFQFSTRLRQRFLKLHRILGRMYVGSALISAPLAIAVAIALPIPTLVMASTIQAIGWVVTAGTAVYCARTGRIQQHREWMIRSYVVTLAFVVFRAIVAGLSIFGVGSLGDRLAVASWACWAIPLILLEPCLQWRKVRRSELRGA